jgi:hypothetical protein
MLPRVPWLWILSLWEGSSGAVMCLMTPDGLWSIGIKKMFSCTRHTTRLACFQDTFMRYRGACKTCISVQCDSTVQRRPSLPLLDITTVVIRPDMTAPQRWPCLVQQDDEIGWLHATDVVQDIIDNSWPVVPYNIGFYLSWGHLSGLVTHCNYPTLSYKRLG